MAKKPIKSVDVALDADFMRDIGLPFNSENQLIDMNDEQGKSFAEIADFIEVYL